MDSVPNALRRPPRTPSTPVRSRELRRLTVLVGTLALLSASQAGCGKRTATIKAGGGKRAALTYQLGDETVQVGAKDLPWELTVRPGALDTTVRLHVSDLAVGESGLTGGWCEVWIGDELCDREDDGTWCACYWDDGVWRGDPNDDSSERLIVR